MIDGTLRAAFAWALAGWAEADRCAEASAALAAEFERELGGRRDRTIAALDEHVLLREALRRAEIARDEAELARDGGRALPEFLERIGQPLSPEELVAHRAKVARAARLRAARRSPAPRACAPRSAPCTSWPACARRSGTGGTRSTSARRLSWSGSTTHPTVPPSTARGMYQ